MERADARNIPETETKQYFMYAWDFANVGAPNNDLAPCTRDWLLGSTVRGDRGTNTRRRQHPCPLTVLIFVYLGTQASISCSPNDLSEICISHVRRYVAGYDTSAD